MIRPQTGAERDREETQRAVAKRRTSTRLGLAGIVLVFAGGIAFALTPLSGLVLLGLMGIGIGLLVAAFLLAPTRVPERLLVSPPK